MSNSSHHFLIATMVTQGHLNPCLHLAKLLISTGATVTLASTTDGLHRVKNFPSLPGLSSASFTDGLDDSASSQDRMRYFVNDFKRVGSQGLTQLLDALAAEGRPVTFLVYHLLLPFAADVARARSIPSALFCSQSATAFAVHHSFFNSKTGAYRRDENSSPPGSNEFPGLPPFSSEDIPSFLFPTNPYHAVSLVFYEHILALEEYPCPRVIINTFDALEEDTIRAFHTSTNINLIPIGPLVLSDKSYGCDLFPSSENYIEWLDSKPESSVVYVSFGSLAVLPRDQIEELFSGLSDSGLAFLWVIREAKEEDEGLVEEMKRRVEEGGKGMVVGWCSQVEVLRHRAVGCFVTHCGWNSTTESLAAGVPVVACPRFSDQTVNAKMLEEVWGSGARVRKMERAEIRAAVDRVMGEEGGEMRKNAAKWRRLAAEAVEKGGSSDNNFRVFMKNLEIKDQYKRDS